MHPKWDMMDFVSPSFQGKSRDFFQLHVGEIRTKFFLIIFKYIAKEGGAKKGRKIMFATIVGITAPSILIKMRECFFCASDFLYSPIPSGIGKIQRIQMNIVQNVKKMRIGCNMNTLGSSLKQSSASPIPLIKIFGIADIKFPQELSYAALYALRKQKMVVVAHNAPRMNVNNSFPRLRRHPPQRWTS